MTALPQATYWQCCSCFYNKIKPLKTSAALGWRVFLRTTDDEHRLTCVDFVRRDFFHQ